MEKKLEEIIGRLAEANVLLNSNMEDVVEHTELIKISCDSSLTSIKTNVAVIEKNIEDINEDVKIQLNEYLAHHKKNTSESIAKMEKQLNSNLNEMKVQLNGFFTLTKSEIINMLNLLNEQSKSLGKNHVVLYGLTSSVNQKLIEIQGKLEIQEKENKELVNKLEMIVLSQSKLNRKYSLIMFGITLMCFVAIILMILRLGR